MLDIVGQIDRRHPALTEFGLDAVAAFQGCVQTGDGVVVSHASNMRRWSANRERVLLQQHPRQTQREERTHDDYAPDPT